jgi:hypothetical protein
MLDTMISIIQWGNLIGLIVLIVLYFTVPIVLRKYVFEVEEDNKSEDNKSEDNKSEDNKSEDNKFEDNKSETKDS